MKARAYAAGTTVSVEKSRVEIDTLLAKHGATSRGVLSDDLAGTAAVIFALEGRHYRIEIPLPRIQEMAPPKGKEPPGWHTWSSDRRAAWAGVRLDQACRERWRALVLLLKAKLEIVAIGLSSVEKEFLADLVLPGGERLHAALQAQIQESYATGQRLLTSGGAP